MMSTPLWKRGARGDFNNAVYIQSFKNLMLDKCWTSRINTTPVKSPFIPLSQKGKYGEDPLFGKEGGESLPLRACPGMY